MTDYYHKNYKEYHERTFPVDPSFFLEPFIKRLAPGASVLDVGCGSGRDLLWLKNRGFDVTGFERSPGLADLARENSACKVIEGDFVSFDFSTLSFDALLASGSLVHIPHDSLADAIKNIAQAMGKNGFFYISLKQGEGIRTDDLERTFYYWKNVGLRELFKFIEFEVVEFITGKSLLNSTDGWLSYILKL